MRAVILCGGQGSRIRDASEVVPKPMLRIGGMPILWHIMKIYAAYGFDEFVLCLGYKGWMIRQFFASYQTMIADCTVTLGRARTIEYHTAFEEQDWRVTLVDTGESTMTGGRVWRVRNYLDDDHFCLTYGDGVADVNIKHLVEQHLASKRAATVTAVRVAGRFGELDIDGTGAVRTFNEKPAITSGRISGGFFVFDNRKIWDYFDDRPQLVLEKDPLVHLARAGELGVYAHDGYWQCMDTLREYVLLNDLWTQNRAPWKVWE